MNKANVPVIIWLLILSFGTGLVAKAQANFRPGYVLPTSGDTLRGEVDSREGGTNAERCRFRATPAASVTTYLPTELRGYGIAGGRQYRSLGMPNSDKRFRVGGQTGLSYFMEILVDGPAQLYSMHMQGYEHYLIASPVLPLALLQYRINKVDREQGSDVVTYQEELTPYRQTLAQALPNCPLAQSKLPTLPYSETDLRRVVALYNECQGYHPAPVSAQGVRVHVRLGLMGGMTQSRLVYDDGSQFHNETIPYYAAPTAGITLSLTVPRISQDRFTLQTAFLYGVEKYDGEYTEPKPGTLNGMQSTRLHLNLAYLRVPLMVRYTYPRGWVRPVLEAGVITALSLRSESSYQSTNYFGEYDAPQPLVPATNFGLFEYGAGIGAGLATVLPGGRTISLLARTEVSYGFANALGISSAVNRYSALLSVDLTK